MSVRFGILALLVEAPGYGYQLRGEFERRTGGTWPLNIGQVYSTLDRLERDGLVERGEVDSDGHVMYRITQSGSDQSAVWFSSPVTRAGGTRDELAVKLALAVAQPEVDVQDLVQTQRRATMKLLQDLTRTKRAADPSTSPEDLSWSLVLESMLFSVEAEVRWLDHVEAMVSRYSGVRSGAAPRPEKAEAPVNARATDRISPDSTEMNR